MRVVFRPCGSRGAVQRREVTLMTAHLEHATVISGTFGKRSLAGASESAETSRQVGPAPTAGRSDSTNLAGHLHIAFESCGPLRCNLGDDTAPNHASQPVRRWVHRPNRWINHLIPATDWRSRAPKGLNGPPARDAPRSDLSLRATARSSGHAHTHGASLAPPAPGSATGGARRSACAAVASCSGAAGARRGLRRRCAAARACASGANSARGRGYRWRGGWARV